MLVRQHAREIGVAEGYNNSGEASGVAASGAAPSAAQGPDLDAAQKVKGERQRLSNPDPPELQKMSRGLEKIEMETKKNLDKVCSAGWATTPVHRRDGPTYRWVLWLSPRSREEAGGACVTLCTTAGFLQP